MTIRVLVIDDSLTIRAMFQELLAVDPAFQLVGTGASAEEALKIIDAAAPDVIAIDLNLPGLDGLALMDALKARGSKVKMILISSSAQRDSDICRQAFDHGALACFDKARLIADGPKLRQLLKDINKGRINRASHREQGTTLPPRIDAHTRQELPDPICSKPI